MHTHRGIHMVYFYFYREKDILQAGISSYQGTPCKFLWIVPPVCKGHQAREERGNHHYLYALGDLQCIHLKVQNPLCRHSIPQNQLFSGQAGKQELTRKVKVGIPVTFMMGTL